MDNPWVWIIGIVAAAAVVALALWLNRGLRFTKNQDGVSLELDGASADDDKRGTNISVGEGLKVGDSGKVGDMVGVQGNVSNADVAVGKDAEISGTAGDIIGVSQGDKTRND